MGMEKQNKIIIGSALGVIVLLIIGFAFFNTTSSVNGNSETFRKSGEISLEDLSKESSCPLNADKIAFAKCLTEKGWKMYGADWCPHCKAQKELFGEEAFKYINYIECTVKADVCSAKRIEGYPTWIVEATSTATSTAQ